MIQDAMKKDDRSVQETAERRGIPVGWVNQDKMDAHVFGAARQGRLWGIPEDAVRWEKHRSGPKPKETSDRSSGKDQPISTGRALFFADELAASNERGDVNVGQI